MYLLIIINDHVILTINKLIILKQLFIFLEKISD